MPKKNKIEDLRDHLFETLEALRDNDNPMDLNRAKAVCDVAEQIIDSARVEVEFVKATDALSLTDFFSEAQRRPALPASPDPTRPNGKERHV